MGPRPPQAPHPPMMGKAPRPPMMGKPFGMKMKARRIMPRPSVTGRVIRKLGFRTPFSKGIGRT